MPCGGIFPIKEIIRQSQTAKSSIAWQAKTLLLNMSRKSFRMQASKFHILVVLTEHFSHRALFCDNVLHSIDILSIYTVIVFGKIEI